MSPAPVPTARPSTRVAVPLLLVLGLLAVLVLADAPERTRFWDALFDAGHAPLFGLLALLIRTAVWARRPEVSETRASLTAFAVTLGLGAASEALQLLQPAREASTGDFLRDAAGAAAFLLLRSAWTTTQKPLSLSSGRRFRIAGALLGVALLAGVTAPLGLVMAQYAARDRAFPTLFRLDGSWWERGFVSTTGAELALATVPAGPRNEADSGGLARLTLRPGEYPGLVLDEPYPDWRGHERLVFTVVSNLDGPLALTIRINDAAHDQRFEDRFNRRLVIAPGENRVEIPLDEVRRAPRGREMDMRRIRLVLLYAHRLERPLELRLGSFRLQ